MFTPLAMTIPFPESGSVNLARLVPHTANIVVQGVGSRITFYGTGGEGALLDMTERAACRCVNGCRAAHLLWKNSWPDRSPDGEKHDAGRASLRDIHGTASVRSDIDGPVVSHREWGKIIDMPLGVIREMISWFEAEGLIRKEETRILPELVASVIDWPH